MTVDGEPELVALRVSVQHMDLSPAPIRREWMDATPERFANRCLPLLIANQSGWLVTLRDEISATWDGGAGRDAVRIESGRTAAGATADAAAARPVTASSHFGCGIVTFSMPWLFRTSPGWNLLVRGPSNWPVDGAYPLEGVVETDWAAATFTMNWLMLRPGFAVRFRAGDPIAMIVPQWRGALERVVPRAEEIWARPELKSEYDAWRTSRLRFNTDLREPGSAAVRARWQRDYFQGTSSEAVEAGHQRRLALRPFPPLAGGGTETVEKPEPPRSPARTPKFRSPLDHLLVLRDWLAGLPIARVALVGVDVEPWRVLLSELGNEHATLTVSDKTDGIAPGCDLLVVGFGSGPDELDAALLRASYVVTEHPVASILSATLDRPEPVVRHRLHVSDHGSGVALLSREDVGTRLPGPRARQESWLWVDPNDAPGASPCGPGSSLEQTGTMREQLRAVLRRHDVRSMLDAPCGDANWMATVDLGGIDYLGVDLLPEYVDAARRRRPDRRYAVLDVLADTLPRADLILCRDLLVHLSFADARAVLAAMAASSSGYLLTTTFTDRVYNDDIGHGDWRPLNLCLPPFGLPSPVDLIVEGCTEQDGAYADKSLGLWPTSAVAAALAG